MIHAVQLDLGHIEGTGNRCGVGTGHQDLVIPDLNLGCTNEATPYGESPEATRPDTRGHTARLRDDTHSCRHPPRCPASGLVDLLSLLWWLGSVGMRGRWHGGRQRPTLVWVLFVPCAADRPRGPNRTRGTRRGRQETNILSSLCFRTFCRRYVSTHSVVTMFPQGSDRGISGAFVGTPGI